MYLLVSSLLISLIPAVQIEHHLPEAYKELQIHCDFIPLHTQPPGAPFTSMVVNLCACTKGHRDHGDKKWCTTFTIGDCKGGELCMHESGLVFDSRPGDMIVFQSQKETHFNLHMSGIRSTVVLHSDRSMDHWAGPGDDTDPPYNRWDKHVY